MTSCSLISREETEFGLETPKRRAVEEIGDTKIPDSSTEANDKRLQEEAESRKNRRRRGDLRRPHMKISDSVPLPNHELLQRGKEKIPLANFDTYSKKELPEDKHIPISKKLPSLSIKNNRDIEIKGKPKCLDDSRFGPRFRFELSGYCHRQEKAYSRSVKELSNFVWCAGPFIRSKLRYATWNHTNFFAKLECDDGTIFNQRYFAEVIKFNHEYGPSIFKVTACVPIDHHYMNVVAENSLKCVICDCDQICHPGSEFCIADVSSLNPYVFKQWTEISKDVRIPEFSCMCSNQLHQFGLGNSQLGSLSLNP